MFGKLNLCRRLVVPSQKIQSDLYIALHKFLVNLYSHLERESLLTSVTAEPKPPGLAGLCPALPELQEEGKGKKNHLYGVPTQPNLKGITAPSDTQGSAFPRGRGLLLLPSHSTNPLSLLPPRLRAGSCLMRGCSASDGSHALNASISTFYFICNLKPMVS